MKTMTTVQILTLFFFSVYLLYFTDARKGNSSITPKRSIPGKKETDNSSTCLNRLIRGKKEADSSSTPPKVDRSIPAHVKNKKQAGWSSSTPPTVDHSIRDNVKDFQTAFSIYKANGVSPTTNKETVYMEVKDGMKHTYYGHAVCKQVLPRMGITNDLKSVEIILDALISADYKYATKIIRERFILYGAKCNYGDGANDFLFVTDTKEKQHYYIFGRDTETKNSGSQLYLKIKACLKIVINKKTEFPVTKLIKETSDSFFAETIYHNFSRLPSSDTRHICTFHSPPPTENRAALICDRYRLKYDYLYEESNDDPKCDWYKINLWLILGQEFEDLRAAECKFKLINSDVTKNILLFNTSSKTSSQQEDHYYVAERYPDSIWRISSIVQLMEFKFYF